MRGREVGRTGRGEHLRGRLSPDPPLWSHMTDLGSQEFWQRIQAEPAKLAAEVCFIDVAVIEATLQKHPALRAWVLAQHEVARIAEERAKWRLTVARARAYMRASGTVDERKSAVDTDGEVTATQEQLFDAQEKRGALRAMADALEDRTAMLIQISAGQRAEKKDYR